MVEKIVAKDSETDVRSSREEAGSKLSIQPINFTATIKTSTGQVIPYASVSIAVVGSNSNGYAHGCADSLGQISGAIPSNLNLVLTVNGYQCAGPLFTQNIGPFSQNTNFGDIVIPASSMSVVTVTGHLNNCSGGNVANGYALLVNNYQVQYAATNASGDFSTNMIVCSANTSVSVVGVDQSGQQQSTPIMATLTAPSTNLGVINACGTASNQFVNYTMDGTNYSFNDASPIDSLTMSTSQTGTTPYYTTIKCNRANQGGDNIWLNFAHTNLAPGTYTIAYMRAQQYSNNNTLLQPSTITLTSFPQAIGQFYEGSFSGQFKDNMNVTHTITNGSFRVRKDF